jgi:hypothetical protein
MFWFINGKKKLEGVREETKKGFESVKKDIVSVSGWIKHLDSENKIQKKDIEEIKNSLSTLIGEIEGIKNIISFSNNLQNKDLFGQPFKANQQVFNKQTAVYPVQTSVQTSVQTPNMDNFSVTERAILFILLNADMKLSYDDLAAMLNKEKSTIRGQINSIKSKNKNIINEKIEKNGKKRVYIDDEMKGKLLKKQKVRVKPSKE